MSYFSDTIDKIARLHPDNDELTNAAYAMLVHTTGVNTTRRDVNRAWAMVRTLQGWDFGEVKDKESKLSPYLIYRFEDIPEEIKAYDDPYVETIRALAKELS